MCIHFPDNFSDHVPVLFELSISLPHVGGSDNFSSHGNTSLHDNIDWHKVDSVSIEAYKICVQTTLPTLSDELQDCSAPNCKSHQPAMDFAYENCCFVCIMLDNNVFHSSVNMLRLCQDGMTPLDYFAVKFYFRIVCGQIMVVPLVVFYRKSGKKPSLPTSMLLDL